MIHKIIGILLIVISSIVILSTIVFYDTYYDESIQLVQDSHTEEVEIIKVYSYLNNEHRVLYRVNHQLHLASISFIDDTGDLYFDKEVYSEISIASELEHYDLVHKNKQFDSIHMISIIGIIVGIGLYVKSLLLREDI